MEPSPKDPVKKKKTVPVETNQDIRVMVQRNKAKAMKRRQDRMTELEEEELLETAMKISEEQERERKRTEERKLRAQVQRKKLLDDIRSKTNEALLRKERKEQMESSKIIQKEHRLTKQQQPREWLP